MIPLRTLDEVCAQIDQFDPIGYAKTRNYLSGQPGSFFNFWKKVYKHLLREA